MEKVTVSVIIITYNCSSIYNCLRLIMEQIDKNDEIIVVDDYSTDDYYYTLQKFCADNGVLLFQSEKHGNRAHNRNLGASYAHNDILVFVDADMMLLDTSISAIKAAYATTDCVAFIGTRSAGRYDPLRMTIFNGVDIQELLTRIPQLDYLSDLPSIRDNRINSMTFVDNLPEQKYYWIYYYSCCCTVWRSLFEQLKGFDESFMGWGVEDIDLGYRISLMGKIAFLRDFAGIHMPHDRNTIYAEQDNCRNLKCLLRKAQRFDVEFISVYRLSARQLESVKEALNRMHMLRIPLLSHEVKKDALFVNCVSMNAPNGYMVRYDINGRMQTYNLIGISTFFADKSISTIIVSGGIVLYPASVICGILQECIRIGKEVILEGQFPDYRLDWTDFPKLTLIQPQKRNEYRIHDMVEFQFSKLPAKNQYLVTSDYLELESDKSVPIKIPVYKIKADAINSQTFCVINLTRGAGYQLLMKQLEKTLQLRFVGIYSILEREPMREFPQHLYSLLLLHTPILLIVECLEDFQLNFAAWEEREHCGDLVVDCMGNFQQF